MTKIILLRHGQSIGNLEGYFQGQIDAELSDIGKKQAELAAKRLQNENIDIIISSPLQRTYYTAVYVNKYHNVPIVINKDIIEINAGCWSGKYINDISEQYPKEWNDWWNNPHKFSVSGGESMIDVYNRTGNALQKIISEHNNKTICIVSHGCAIRCMMCHIYNKPIEYINNIGWGTNTSINIVQCSSLYNKDTKIVAENDIGHLSSMDMCSTWVTKI